MSRPDGSEANPHGGAESGGHVRGDPALHAADIVDGGRAQRRFGLLIARQLFPPMMRINRLVVASLRATVVCSALAAVPVSADTEVNVVLDPVDGTRPHVTATVSAPDDPALQTTLMLQADGLSPLARYTVWLHAGSVQQPGASAAYLGDLDADDGGQASLRTESAQAGAVDIPVALSPELLCDGEHLIEVRDPSLTLVAIGQLPMSQLDLAAHPADGGAGDITDGGPDP